MTLPRTASVVVIGGRREPSINLSLFDPARFQDGHADRGDRGPDAE